MLEPLLPPDEAIRLAALRSLNILDTPAEERFDRITRLAQRLFDVPIALVSLVDTNRQWFKSCQGLDASETPRSISFCGHAILEDGPLIIEDATKDQRFADNPLVTGPPDIRFYTGQPLKAANGSRIGTLCVIDRKPHHLTQDQLDALRDLAIMVEAELNVVDFKNAARIIRSSENRLHAILDNVADAIITIDDKGIVETINQAGEEIFAYSAAELVGQNIKILMPHPYHDEHDRYIQNFVNTGQARMIGLGREVTGLRKDGSTFPLELSISEMQIGTQRMFTGIVRDITERKKIEILKNEFVSMVSHELRTPLTSIRGSLGLLATGMGGELTEQSKTLIDIAYRNSERLGRLINDILDIEKIESGKMNFELHSQLLMPLLQTAIESNASYGRQYGIKFSITHSIPDVLVKVDSDRLVQIMSNLLSNAAKFSPSGGTVEISVTQEGSYITVAVIDQGSGIPDAFRDKVFLKFSQADSSDTRQKGGTGLGLSITKAMVERMGGNINFECQQDTGTRFYFTLPMVNSD